MTAPATAADSVPPLLGDPVRQVAIPGGVLDVAREPAEGDEAAIRHDHAEQDGEQHAAGADEEQDAAQLGERVLDVLDRPPHLKREARIEADGQRPYRRALHLHGAKLAAAAGRYLSGTR